MKSSNSPIAQLKLLLSLEEKRAELENQLSSLGAQINGLKQQLVSGTPAPAKVSVASAAPVAKSAPVRPGRPSKPARAGRGELKSQIFSALEKAGAKGVKVLDLAHALKTNPANIYAWFHAAVKRYPTIKKVGSAEYRLTGAAPKAAPAAKAAPAPKASTKPAKAPAINGAAKGSKRGALQARIIAALKSAGSGGITVKGLSEKFRMPYRNVQVWFATTGKKDRAIKKVAPATYRYAA